jgi:hypothetical protein
MKSMRRTLGLAVNLGGLGLMLWQLCALLH